MGWAFGASAGFRMNCGRKERKNIPTFGLKMLVMIPRFMRSLSVIGIDGSWEEVSKVLVLARMDWTPMYMI